MIPFSLGVASTPAPSSAAVFQELWKIGRDQFSDSKLDGVDWEPARNRYAGGAAAAQTSDQFADVVSEMLSELRSSHTHYYTPKTPE